MFDIQLSLSIFPLGAASLTALDLAVIAETGCTDLTDPAGQAKLLARLQTGWLSNSSQNRSFSTPLFAQERIHRFADGTTNLEKIWAAEEAPKTGNGQETPPAAESLLGVLKGIVDRTRRDVRRKPHYSSLLEMLDQIRREIAYGNRLEARFLMELAMIMYSDAEHLTPLRPVMTVDWIYTNPLPSLVKIGKLLESLHERTRSSRPRQEKFLEMIEQMQGMNARTSSLIHLGKLEEAQGGLEDFLERNRSLFHEMPPTFGGLLYFFEGALQAINAMRASPNGLAALIYQCIDIARRDLPQKRAETDVPVLRRLLLRIDTGRKKNTVVDSVKTLIRHAAMESAGTLQSLLESLLRKLQEVPE